jgi:Flp pilus assembly protein TadB
MGRDDEDRRSAMNETGPMDELRRSRKSMWRMRWLLVGLSALLAVALIVSGVVLIGVIIGVMAVVRAVMIVRWQHYGDTLRQQYRGNPPSG